MPARKRKKGKSRAAGRWLDDLWPRGAPRLELESHQLDVLALALLALGIFLGGVAYLHWAGGTLGRGAVNAARLGFGALGYALPVALGLAGVLILMRETRPPMRPVRTGVLCLILGLTLAVAAGTFGLGPGSLSGHAAWRAHALEARGGVLGQAELWVLAHVISTVGAQILSVFLVLAGVILVSGAGLAGVIRATSVGVAGTGRAIKRSTEELAQTMAWRPDPEAYADPPPPAEAMLPPEPDTAELVVRATHVEAPPIESDDAEEEPFDLPAGPEDDEQEGFDPPQEPADPP
ncbi:MAG TPA: hypothetical protein VGY32_00640, partial [Solirubrobacteraceae bacterium]|nr:hypothetical protein [Solirubrobacteraceae bacterium]